jgi:carboxymethylenebutenolidase
VRLVKEPVECFAVPPHDKLQVRLENGCNSVEGGEWHTTNQPALQSADRGIGKPGPKGEVHLPKLLASAQSADGSAEADRVHARQDVGRHLRTAAQPFRDGEPAEMCFDHDSRPPIAPIKGGALESRELTLTAEDGNRFSAFDARAAEPSGAAVIILPDVRGLHAYYVDLALRFAENGIDALAIDYFGRTAGLGRRDNTFEYMPHVSQTTFAGLSSDIRAAAAAMRGDDARRDRARALFTVGFCFGGRVSFVAATLGLDLAGVIGFYGFPVGPGRNDVPAPVDVAPQIASPVLGLFGGADQAIPETSVAAFDAALTMAGVEHHLTSYRDAPHSFFDRKADEFSRTSEAAWTEVLAFIRTHTAQAARA